jgi:hypothetical protein
MVTDMNGRRQFLGGLLATGLIPKLTWADAGSPSFLSAAAKPDGSHVLCGIGDNLQVLFQIPLPARGHAATAHPTKPEAVAFARRPGTFALVIDCVSGTQTARLDAPHGRHFYGHGTFSADGDLLFTTENDYDAGQGRIGVWDARQGYRRIDEWSSGGIGPHDIQNTPHRDTLVVANGGIDTHPDSGRAKLNIPTMRPNLAYVTSGGLIEVAELPRGHQKNSIRHLAVSDAGEVAFGMQWQDEQSAETLVGLHRLGAPVQLMSTPQDDVRKMNGYVGSIAFGKGGRTVVATSPRGGIVQFFDTVSQSHTQSTEFTDACGLAAHNMGLVVSSGTGELRQIDQNSISLSRNFDLAWDNHLVAIG